MKLIMNTSHPALSDGFHQHTVSWTATTTSKRAHKIQTQQFI